MLQENKIKLNSCVCIEVPWVRPRHKKRVLWNIIERGKSIQQMEIKVVQKVYSGYGNTLTLYVQECGWKRKSEIKQTIRQIRLITQSLTYHIQLYSFSSRIMASFVTLHRPSPHKSRLFQSFFYFFPLIQRRLLI